MNDPNIDPEIDPSIGSQSGIFTKFTEYHDASPRDNIPYGNHHHHQNDSTNGYTFTTIDDHQNHSNSGSDSDPVDAATAVAAVAAAANLSSLISFNPSQNTNDSRNKTQEQLNFLHNTLDLDHDTTSSTNIHSRLQRKSKFTPESPSITPESQPKQQLIHDDDSQVSIVVVNPASSKGTGRLGRPRKHTSQNTADQSSSTKNLDESVVSKFRVDSKPLNGPGSRGGRKNKSSSTRNKVGPNKRKVQQLLNLSNKRLKSYEIFKNDEEIPIIDVSDSDENEKENKQLNFKEESQASDVSQDNIVHETNESDHPTAEDAVAVNAATTTATVTDVVVEDANDDIDSGITNQGTGKDTHTDKSSKADEEIDVIDVSDSESENSPVTPPRSSQIEQSATPATPKIDPFIILEDYDTLKAKGRSTAREDKLLKKVATQLSLSMLGQQTLHPKPKKELSGPIVGVSYDSYENINQKSLVNLEDKDFTKIALGFKVKPAPYAKDIIAILSFFNKFRHHFSNLPNLGPQDLEEGLKLPPSAAYPLPNANQKTGVKLFNEKESTEVSSFVEKLFLDLLGLLLNKKSAITKRNLSRTLDEFKNQVLTFGLPSEWRDDSEVFQEQLNDIYINNSDGERVDPNTPILDISRDLYGTTKPLDHTPLDNADFEEEGLNALKPIDRLILLRSMVQWTLSYSIIIKEEISETFTKADFSSDRNTSYVSRFVKEGESGIELAKRMSKPPVKKKPVKNDTNANLDTNNEELETIAPIDPSVDPEANPLDHSLSFRLLDFYSGDGGVNGRFFLCRSADSKSLGFSSLEDFKKVLTKTKHELLSLKRKPSRFKLYVQDLSTTLAFIPETETSQLSMDENIDPWYEIAGDSEELQKFINHLSRKLNNVRHIQLSNLLKYLSSILPSLKIFEEINNEFKSLVRLRKSNEGSSRTLRSQDRVLRQLFDNPEHQDIYGNDDENESDEDVDEEEDNESNNDDPDDEDY